MWVYSFKNKWWFNLLYGLNTFPPLLFFCEGQRSCLLPWFKFIVAKSCFSLNTWQLCSLSLSFSLLSLNVFVCITVCVCITVYLSLSLFLCHTLTYFLFFFPNLSFSIILILPLLCSLSLSSFLSHLLSFSLFVCLFLEVHWLTLVGNNSFIDLRKTTLF